LTVIPAVQAAVVDRATLSGDQAGQVTRHQLHHRKVLLVETVRKLVKQAAAAVRPLLGIVGQQAVDWLVLVVLVQLIQYLAHQLLTLRAAMLAVQVLELLTQVTADLVKQLMRNHLRVTQVL
jgi:hypothetical protein